MRLVVNVVVLNVVGFNIVFLLIQWILNIVGFVNMVVFTIVGITK